MAWTASRKVRVVPMLVAVSWQGRIRQLQVGLLGLVGDPRGSAQTYIVDEVRFQHLLNSIRRAVSTGLPVLAMGDFNCQHSDWSSGSSDTRGKELQTCVMNWSSPFSTPSGALGQSLILQPVRNTPTLSSIWLFPLLPICLLACRLPRK